MNVELIGETQAHALEVARQRHEENVRRGLAGRHGGPSSGARSLEVHKLGALGEAALAVALGVPWGKGDYRSPDVGRLQVRTTVVPRWGLRLRPADADHEVFVFARVHPRPAGARTLADPITVELAGWIRAVDGKVPRYLVTDSRYLITVDGARPPCWLVPMGHLRTMTELPTSGIDTRNSDSA